MNAYTIYLKSGTPVTVYTPQKVLPSLGQEIAGCPVKHYSRDNGTLELDLTLNQKNQLKWMKEQKQLLAEMGEFSDGIRQRALEMLMPKLEIEIRAKMAAEQEQSKLVLPE